VPNREFSEAADLHIPYTVLPPTRLSIHCAEPEASFRQCPRQVRHHIGVAMDEDVSERDDFLIVRNVFSRVPDLALTTD